ncbi:hypothetical protein E2320_010373, partial [Naja naja]
AAPLVAAREFTVPFVYILLQIILNIKRQWQETDMGKQIWNLLNYKSTIKLIHKVPHNMMHSTPVTFSLNKCQDMRNFPVLEGKIPSFCRHIIEGNARNCKTCIERYSELLEKASKSRRKSTVLIHTQTKKKLLVRIGRISGIWCSFMANDSVVKGGTIYPITLKKILRSQEIAIKNKLPFVYMVDSGGAFLPLQAELFADQFHGGRLFYNQAVMSALKIPQVSIVCGSCTAGGAYIPVMSEETSIVDKIGTVFLAGPPLVKAATGEDTNPEELGGASVHAKVSGCVDHFATSEKEAFEYIKNAISALNYVLPIEESLEFDNPLYSDDDLLGLAPQDYSYTLHIKLILSRIIDGSRFQEFKANYGITLVTGFAYIEGELVGIVANNGELTQNASLKGCHFIQLCSQRNIPILFLMNTAPYTAETTNLMQAEDQANRLKAQASMMAAVACASVPKITVVIGGCLGNESYAMVIGQCLRIMKQQRFRIVPLQQSSFPIMRMKWLMLTNFANHWQIIRRMLYVLHIVLKRKMVLYSRHHALLKSPWKDQKVGRLWSTARTDDYAQDNTCIKINANNLNKKHKTFI